MTMATKAKKQVTTVQHLHRWKAASYALNASTYIFPLIPFGTILGINWSNWFGQDQTQGWSIGVGFGMLLVSLTGTIIGILKRDEVAKSNISALYYLAILFAAWGFTFMFLASIMNEFGKYFLYFSMSLVGSGTSDQVNKKYCSKWLAFYEKVAEDNSLTTSGNKRKLAREQAIKEAAEKEAKNHQAVD